MVDLSQYFDTSVDAEDLQGGAFDAIPAGEYMMQLTEIRDKETNKGGKMLSLGFQVIDGERRGAMIWENVNYVNENEKAVAMARRTLRDMALALGYTDFRDVESMMFKAMLIRVSLEPDNRGPGYPERNRIKNYRAPTNAAPRPANAAPQSHSRPAAPPPPAANAGNTRPWAR